MFICIIIINNIMRIPQINRKCIKYVRDISTTIIIIIIIIRLHFHTLFGPLTRFFFIHT